MKLSQLLYFQMVCKHFNITRAAEELFVSQPAISTAIRELEKELEVKLFLRHNNRLYLTQEGQLLLERAHRILEDVARIKTDLTKKEEGKQDLYVGLPPIVYTFFLPVLLRTRKQLHEAHPGLKIHLHEVPAKELAEKLQKQELDVVIAFVDDQSFPSMEKEILGSCEMKLCVHREHPLVHHAAVKEGDYRERRLLTCFHEDAVYTSAVARWYQEQGREPRFLSPYQQSQTIETMMLSGNEASLLSPKLCRFSDQIVGIPLEKPLLLTMGLVWDCSRPLSNPMIELLEKLRQMEHGL